MSNKLIENFYNNPCTPIKDGEVITSCNMDYNNINYANIPDNHKGCNQNLVDRKLDYSSGFECPL